MKANSYLQAITADCRGAALTLCLTRVDSYQTTFKKQLSGRMYTASTSSSPSRKGPGSCPPGKQESKEMAPHLHLRVLQGDSSQEGMKGTVWGPWDPPRAEQASTQQVEDGPPSPDGQADRAQHARPRSERRPSHTGTHPGPAPARLQGHCLRPRRKPQTLPGLGLVTHTHPVAAV